MQEEQFDKLLREAFIESDHYVPDNGFTGRVASRLPKFQTAKRVRMVTYILASILAVVAIYFFRIPVSTMLLTTLSDVLYYPRSVQFPPMTSLIVAGGLVLGILGILRSEYEEE